MTRYAQIAWPIAGFLVALALVAQEYIIRSLAGEPPLLLTAWRVGVMTLAAVCITLLFLPGRRTGYVLGALVCAGLIGYALYAQYVLGLEPCPLCAFQRMAVIGCGIVFTVAALHGPRRTAAKLYALLTLIVAGVGAGVSIRHLWLQSLPASEVPACGPGLGYMMETLPFAEVLAKVFAGSGECAAVDWQFLGLSLPGWTLVFFVTMIVAAIALVDRD